MKSENQIQVYEQVWLQVREHVSNQVLRKVDPLVRDLVWKPGVNHVWIQVKNQVWLQVLDTVYEENDER